MQGVVADVRIETDFGPVPAMLLRPRDRLRTAGGGFVKLTEIQTIAFDVKCIAAHPQTGGIRIEEGVFGAGLPRQPVTIAPGQLIEGDPQRSGTDAVSAEQCIGLPGVARVPSEETVYHMIRCDRPARILAEGLPLRV